MTQQQSTSDLEAYWARTMERLNLAERKALSELIARVGKAELDAHNATQYAARLKRGETRTVYLPPQAADALKRQQQRDRKQQLKTGRRSSQILTPPRASVMHPSTYWREFKAVLRAAKLDPDAFHLHDLRHTYGTLAALAGVAPKDAQAQMGHANLGMTLGLYTHATDEGQRDAARRLGRKLGGE